MDHKRATPAAGQQVMGQGIWLCPWNCHCLSVALALRIHPLAVARIQKFLGVAVSKSISSQTGLLRSRLTDIRRPHHTLSFLWTVKHGSVVVL